MGGRDRQHGTCGVVGTHFVNGQRRDAQLFLKSFADGAASGASGDNRGEDAPGESQFVDDLPAPGTGGVVQKVGGGNVGVFS